MLRREVIGEDSWLSPRRRPPSCAPAVSPRRLPAVSPPSPRRLPAVSPPSPRRLPAVSPPSPRRLPAAAPRQHQKAPGSKGAQGDSPGFSKPREPHPNPFASCRDARSPEFRGKSLRERNSHSYRPYRAEREGDSLPFQGFENPWLSPDLPLAGPVPPCLRASVPPCLRASVPPCLRASVPPPPPPPPGKRLRRRPEITEISFPKRAPRRQATNDAPGSKGAQGDSPGFSQPREPHPNPFASCRDARSPKVRGKSSRTQQPLLPLLPLLPPLQGGERGGFASFQGFENPWLSPDLPLAGPVPPPPEKTSRRSPEFTETSFQKRIPRAVP